MWGKGPAIFNKENAYEYGKWLGKRYRNYANIIWVLGGDRPLLTSKHFDIINAMAAGLKEGDQGKHLMTFIPWVSIHLHFMYMMKIARLNMIQSGQQT